MASGKVYIGTSGWKYSHWDGVFYPADLKKKDQLSYFTENFDTVELNNSFYRQPGKDNFIAWRLKVPDNFVFAVKANRYFTHLKKLKVESADVMDFLEACSGLEEKLGPILFQLPPRWKLNTGRLERFLSLLPKGNRYTFEFRETSWYTEQVYDLLKKYNCAFCIYHLAGHQSPIISTADFVYIRLHGPGDKYQGEYNQTDLAYWSKLCKGWLNDKKDVYIYFDNDQSAYAAFNAIALKKLLPAYK